MIETFDRNSNHWTGKQSSPSSSGRIQQHSLEIYSQNIQENADLEWMQITGLSGARRIELFNTEITGSNCSPPIQQPQGNIEWSRNTHYVISNKQPAEQAHRTAQSESVHYSRTQFYLSYSPHGILRCIRLMWRQKDLGCIPFRDGPIESCRMSASIWVRMHILFSNLVWTPSAIAWCSSISRCLQVLGS